MEELKDSEKESQNKVKDDQAIVEAKVEAK